MFLCVCLGSHLRQWRSMYLQHQKLFVQSNEFHKILQLEFVCEMIAREARNHTERSDENKPSGIIGAIQAKSMLYEIHTIRGTSVITKPHHNYTRVPVQVVGRLWRQKTRSLTHARLSRSSTYNLCINTHLIDAQGWSQSFLLEAYVIPDVVACTDTNCTNVPWQSLIGIEFAQFA